MTDGPKDNDTDIGYGRPPKATRFKKGQRANPKGRPRNRHLEPPYEAVLGQMVTIREEGKERQVTAAEAFILHMTKQGLEGDGAAGRAAMTEIGKARQARTDRDGLGPPTIIIGSVRPGSVNKALEPLRMARKLDRYRKSARMALEPWIVEAALERLGDKRLSRPEQTKVVSAIRTPHKVNWPDWWEVRG